MKKILSYPLSSRRLFWKICSVYLNANTMQATRR